MPRKRKGAVGRKLSGSTVGARIRALRERLGYAGRQGDFAELLSCSQGTLSAWERDDPIRKPSSAVYLRLAMLASSSEDASYFLALARIERDAVFSLAERLGAERIASASAEDVVRIGPLQGSTDHGTLLLQRALVPNPNFTYYAATLSYLTWLALSHGLIVIDTKGAGGPLDPFFDKIIVVRSKQSFRGEPEHQVGRLHFISPYRNEELQSLEPPTAVLAGDLDPGPLGGMTVGRFPHEFWDPQEILRLWQGDLELAHLKTEAALNDARQEMRPVPAIEIVGRVLAWFAYPNPGQVPIDKPPSQPSGGPQESK